MHATVPRLSMGLLAWVALTSPLVAQGKDGVHVCIGADRIVQHAPGAACGSGQVGYLLAEEEGDIQSREEEKQADKEMRELTAKVKALTERIAQLERSGHDSAGGSKAVGNKVSAPFEVLDEGGNAILRVTTNDLRNEAPKDANIVIGRAPGGNYWIRMRSENGAEALDLAMTKAGQGFVQAYDPTQGATRSLFGWKGVSLFWSDDKESAALQIGDGGGGMLALAKGGMLMMEAGSTAEGRGVVRVGPNFTCTGTRLASGMGAPDCIMGRLGGSIK